MTRHKELIKPIELAPDGPAVGALFDFDGTLAYPLHDPPFHPRTLEYLKALRYAGAAWVIISGRGLENLIRGFGENGLFILPDFIIANEYEIHMPDGKIGRAHV